MSYQEKLDSALALVRESNSVLHPNYDGKGPNHPEGWIDSDRFVQCIKFKARNEDALKGLRYENILECLPTAFGVKPDSLAKDIAKVFRGSEIELPVAPGGVLDKRPINPRRVDGMSIRQLVENFDPMEPTSPIGKRLKEIARGEPFIVFGEGRALDVESTLKLLEELKNNPHLSGRKDYDVNGQTKEVFRVGDIPEIDIDENPLYPSRPLRPDGTCDQTGRSWAGVSLNARQLLYLAVKSGEINVTVANGLMLANNIMSVALGADAFAALKKEFGLRKAATEFTRLEKTGDLPKLKLTMRISANKATGPFEGGRAVRL